MATIQRFEDIEAWKQARVLTQHIYSHTTVGKFSRDFGLRDQIQRSSVSIMANIAEGFERDGAKEFLQFLSNAKGSCGEVRSHLCVAHDQSYLSKSEFQKLYSEVIQIARMLSGLITYLKTSSPRGIKFKSPDVVDRSNGKT